MAEAPRSSFIPKQTSSAVPSSVRKRRRFHAFNFLTSLLLVVSLGLAGAAYFYKGYVEGHLATEKANLAAERERFSEEDIAEIREFDRRLKGARVLLDSHISPSKIFDALELSTLGRVQFTSFGFAQRPSQDITLTIRGGTQEFKSVVLQSLEFGENPLLSNAVVTSIGTEGTDVENTQGESGDEDSHRVNFSVVGNITASLLAFAGDTEPAAQDEVPAVEPQMGSSTETASSSDADQAAENLQ